MPNSMVRKDHHTYTKTILSSFKDNPKRFYGYIRNLQIAKCQVTQLEKSDGKSTSNDYEAAELLCKSFEQIFLHLKQNSVQVTPTNSYLLPYFQQVHSAVICSTKVKY